MNTFTIIQKTIGSIIAVWCVIALGYLMYKLWPYTDYIGILILLVILYMGAELLLTFRVNQLVHRKHMIMDLEDRDGRRNIALIDGGTQTKKWSNEVVERHKSIALPSGQETLLLESGDRYIPTMVALEDYVDPSTSNLSRLFLGLTSNDEPIYADFKSMFHVIIAGTTRWGKSEFIRCLFAQWLWSAEEDMEFYLIDTGGTTFKDFGLPFVEDARQAQALIADLRTELERRKDLFAGDRYVKSLDTYNYRNPENKLSRLVIIIEEGLDLIEERESIKPELTRLVSWAAKYGLHVVFISQSVKTTVVSNEMRGNFSSRFQFKAEDLYQANTLVRGSQADKFTNRGRFKGIINGEPIPETQSPMVHVDTAIKAGDQYLSSTGNVFNPETYVWDIPEMEVVDLGHESDVEVGRQFEALATDPNKFSWRKATKTIYGPDKWGESYNTKLRKTLDRLGIKYDHLMASE